MGHKKLSERGASLIEIMIVLVVISILVAIVLAQLGNKDYKARMARCHNELRSIQSTIFNFRLQYNRYPGEETVWEDTWRGRNPGPYAYLLDDDENNGHGNDLDGNDQGNAGNRPHGGGRIDFVLVCDHDHGELASYVYVIDEGRPTLAVPGDDPGYDRLADRRGNGVGGVGKSKGKNN